MKRKNILIGAALGVVLALTGCSASSTASTEAFNQGEVVDTDPDNNVYVQDGMLKENRYELSDGRTVTCLALLGPRQGGLSCDWSNAK